MDKIQKFKVWSQIKDGRKIVSKRDKQSATTIEVPPHSSLNLRLDNSVENIETGFYVLDVNILQENKQRPKRFSTEVQVKKNNQENSIKEETVAEQENILKEETETESSKQNKVIFESETAKQRKMTPYIFALVIGLVAIYGMIRK